MLSLLLVACVAPAEPFYEDFSAPLDPKRWITSSWVAPRSDATNHSTFSAENAVLHDGLLVLKLTQKQNDDGSVTSVGGEVKTVAKFGYGVYEFELRSSSTSPDPVKPGGAISGSITGTGPFVNSSETEIDVEMEGLHERADLVQTTTWVHENKPHETRKVLPQKAEDAPYLAFHRYKISWTRKSVAFYQDDRLIAVHSKIVPATPAHFIFNHWGTNSLNWGGLATPGVDRYMYVKSFKYTPH